MTEKKDICELTDEQLNSVTGGKTDEIDKNLLEKIKEGESGNDDNGPFIN